MNNKTTKKRVRPQLTEKRVREIVREEIAKGYSEALTNIKKRNIMDIQV